MTQFRQCLVHLQSIQSYESFISFICYIGIRLIHQCHMSLSSVDIHIASSWFELDIIFRFNTFVLPSIEALFGRMVTAPSATSSWSSIGEFFAPQLSEPTNKKWPVRLAFLAACNTRLKEDRLNIIFITHFIIWCDYQTRHYKTKHD